MMGQGTNDLDINLLVKPRNARILRFMRMRGWKSVGGMCREIGLNESQIGRLVNMTISPLNHFARWRPYAIKLATALHVMVEDLWPDHLRQVIASKASTEFEVSLDQAMAIHSHSPDPALLLENRELIHDLLSALTPRERAVIGMRMDGVTLEDTGNQLGEMGLGRVTGERLRQIEHKAYRKIRVKAYKKYHIKNMADLLT